MTVHYLDPPVARIGREIQRIRTEQNLTYREIAKRCNRSLNVLFPGKQLGSITESRITKIVEAFQHPNARGAAKQIEDYELAAIPHALRFSLDEVLGENFKRCAYIWDPLADPEYSETLLRLLQKHGTDASELVGWAEFLPCSMETPEFMEAHHLQLFKGQLAVSAREWRQMMIRYNEFGHRRRALVLSQDRTWNMKQLMKVSDLERIVNGVGEFAFDKRIRREQLEYLVGLISSNDSRMEFILAEDDALKVIDRTLRDYDSQFTIDDRITVWRSHAGRLGWSEEPGYIAQHRAILDEFEKLAQYKTSIAVRDQLLAYLEMIR
jgi:transcriptional regulator with XRE-family HTH domain